MRILIAEDDGMYRHVLQAMLGAWGYDVVAAVDGLEAWEVLRGEDCPALALLDWMMPGMDGPELCRRVRAVPVAVPVYLILLTAREAMEDLVAGLASGANDYVTEPFDQAELKARLEVGRNVVELQRNLVARVRELELALAQVKQLQGLLPICSYCKKIRDDKNYWQQVESYIARHTEARFSHGICPDCYRTQVQPELDKLGRVNP